MYLHRCGVIIVILFCCYSANGQYRLTGPTSAPEGSTVTFTCTTSPVQIGVIWSETSDSNTSNYVYFYKSGRCQRSTGAPPSDYTFACNSTGVFSLSFPAEFNRHSGSVFQCRNSAGGGESNNITLSVTGQYRLSGPTSAPGGSTVTLTCTTSPVQTAVDWRETSGSNTSSYLYFYNSGRCQRSAGAPPSDYTFDCNSTGVFSLSFPADFSRHSGNVFQCRSAAGAGESNNITFSVTVQLTRVTLLNATNSPLTLVQGTDVTLVCETNPTDPKFTISWRRDGQTVSQGVTSSTRQETEGLVTVSVWSQRVQWTDRGTYSCEANNSGINGTSQDLTLVVLVPVSFVTLTNITSNNQQVSVNQDTSLVLTCRSSPAYPPPIVTWYVNSSMTSSVVDSKTETQTSGQIVTVSTITRTMRKNNDQDTFYCRAENINREAGTQSKTARANVFFPPDIRLSPREGPQNTDLTLTCTATGNPSNYRFEDFRQYWGDQLIQRRGGTQTGDSYCLDLPQVSYQDSGVYICTVSNNLTRTTQRNTTVTVKASPVYTKDVDPTEPVGAEVGHSASLVQYVYCSPNYTSVSWHFNTTSRLRTDSSNVSSSPVHLDVYGTRVEVAGFKLVYTVTNFTQEHVGLYTVRVCNRVGCAESAIKLVVSAPPETPLHFTALSSCTDSVTLTWTPQYAGGNYTQEFHVEFQVQSTSGEWSSRVFPLSQDKSGVGVVDGLDSNTGYMFRIKSVTDRKTGNNQSPISEEIYFSTKEIPRQLTERSSLGVGAGIGIGVGLCLLLAVATVAVVVFFRRQAGTERTRRNTESQGYREDTATGSKPGQSMYAQMERTDDSYEKLGNVYQNSNQSSPMSTFTGSSL